MGIGPETRRERGLTPSGLPALHAAAVAAALLCLGYMDTRHLFACVMVLATAGTTTATAGENDGIAPVVPRLAGAWAPTVPVQHLTPTGGKLPFGRSAATPSAPRPGGSGSLERGDVGTAIMVGGTVVLAAAGLWGAVRLNNSLCGLGDITSSNSTRCDGPKDLGPPLALGAAALATVTVGAIVYKTSF
jgi:hypothetical protein